MSSDSESKPKRTRKTKTSNIIVSNKPPVESKPRSRKTKTANAVAPSKFSTEAKSRTRKTKAANVVVPNKTPIREKRSDVRRSSRNTTNSTTSSNKKKQPSMKNTSCSCENSPCICEPKPTAKDMLETPKPKTKTAKRPKKTKMYFEHLKPEWMTREPENSKCCDTDPCSCKIFPKFATLKEMYTPCRVEKAKKKRSKTEFEPTPSTSSAPDSSKKEYVISPKIMNYFMNAYKQSPQYADLKNKRFNTSFRSQRVSSCASPDFQLFTPEEDAEFARMQEEYLPEIRNEIRGVPGEKYANVFKSIPLLESVVLDDEEKPKETSKGRKRKDTSKKGGMKKMNRSKLLGYQGVPFPDEHLLFSYPDSFVTNTVSLDIDMKGKDSIILPKELLEKGKK